MGTSIQGVNVFCWECILLNFLNQTYKKRLKLLEGDVIGEAYNSADRQDVVAVTYGIASDGGNNLADLSVKKESKKDRDSKLLSWWRNCPM